MRVQPRRHARFIHLLGVVLAIGTTVSGCASSSCTGDPRTDSVACAASKIDSGAYERDTKAMASALADQKQQVASEREKGRQLRARLSALRARRQRVERELTALQARLNRFAQQRPGQEARIAGLQAAIAKAVAEQRAARVRLDELASRVESGKAAASAKATAQEERVILEEEAALIEEERGARLYAQQVEELTRT
jgi:chromosome segregation ATPase